MATLPFVSNVGDVMITRRRLVVGLGTVAAGIAFSGRWARSASPVSVDEVDLGTAPPSPVPTLLAPVPITFAVSHLGARWVGEEDTEIELRWRPAESAWGDWRRLAVSPDLGDPDNGVWYSGLLVARQAIEVQARVVRGVARRITLITIDSSDGTGTASEERPNRPSRPARLTPAPPRLPLRRRS